MVVNSFEFWGYFIVFLLLYFILGQRSNKLQNILLLVASYVFYAAAEWKMVPLLLISTAVFYYLGIWISQNIHNHSRRASQLTTLGVLLGVGVLFYFKYLNFCVDQFVSLFNLMGFKVSVRAFNILMPLGVSFFTFKLISYVVEVHRANIEPCRNIVDFGIYIAFFPTIMSGPIDRPGEFIPQLKQVRKANYNDFAEGARRIVWGMFLKLCIADRLTEYTSTVLGFYGYHNSNSILMAMVLYTFQVYADFCGYSEMAIGVSRILGIKVRENFLRPFFCKTIQEYWLRWHMSLTTWITDYIFMPLNIAFRSIGNWGLYLATFINLVVIGAWHGANWTFILFGMYHGLLLVFDAAISKRRKRFEKKHNLKTNIIYKYANVFVCFMLVTIGLTLFQAKDLSAFIGTMQHLSTGFGDLFYKGGTLYITLMFIFIMLLKEMKDEHGLNIHLLHSEKLWVRMVSFSALVVLILLMGDFYGGGFIYFQF